MCKTLNIATRGRFSCSSKTRVTTGLICCDITVIPPKKDIIYPNKSSNTKVRYKTPVLDNESKIDYLEILKQEDEEILLIIKMFMKCQ